MAFVAIEDHTRLVDPERRLELLRDETPTGSSGFLAFRLVGPGVDGLFFAKTSTIATLTGSQNPADRDRIVWLIFANADLDHPDHARMRALIDEAMVAFRSWFGQGRPECSYSTMLEPGDGAGR